MQPMWRQARLNPTGMAHRSQALRGVFRSVHDLESAITCYIAAINRNPNPFVWTATAKTIQAKLTLNHPSESVQ